MYSAIWLPSAQSGYVKRNLVTFSAILLREAQSSYVKRNLITFSAIWLLSAQSGYVQRNLVTFSAIWLRTAQSGEGRCYGYLLPLQTLIVLIKWLSMELSLVSGWKLMDTFLTQPCGNTTEITTERRRQNTVIAFRVVESL